MKKMYFKVKLRILYRGCTFYVGDGIICVQDDTFEGYIALDYIMGIYKDGNIEMKLCKYDFEYGTSYSVYKEKIDGFELPNRFIMNNILKESGEVAHLQILNKITVKKSEFEEDISKIKEKFIV